MYPEPIQEFANNLIEHLKDVDRIEGTKYPISYDHLHNSVCEDLMPKWIAGEDMVLSEESFSSFYNQAFVAATIEGLVKKGLVDTIDSDQGEVVFLTQKGKAVHSRMQSTKTEDDEKVPTTDDCSVHTD